VVTPHARFSIDADLFAPYEVIGELGARPIPLYVVRQSALAAGGAQLAVAEHFPGACRGDAGGRSDLRREARRISTLANPHVARVREVAVRGDDLVVFGDFLDGEKLTRFWGPGQWLPLETALRVLLDVLTGVGALHALRDSNQQPMKLTHGEISPATILFGSDGVARVLHAIARRAADAAAEAASLPYLAPEVHANDAYDGRADVFSVGVLLWEVLEGKRLSSDGEEPAGVRVRSAPLPPPRAPDGTPWSKALVPVVTRALASAPEDRWPTAAAMAAEIRKAAGLKLAAASAAAAFAKNKFGERAKERRVRWESRPSRPPGAAPILGRPAPVSAPVIRSEEFSSSVLESFRPPPPPQSSPARIDAPFASGWDWEPPSAEVPVVTNIAAPVAARPDREPPGLAPQAVAPAVAPSDAPGMAQVDALVDEAAGGVPLDPAIARADSAFSIPPLEPPAFSIPEPPPSAEAAVPIEAPVVFDEAEVGPVRAPFGDASPLPPALSSSGAPSGGRSRRRHALIAGVAALGIGAASLIAVRASHHAAPPAVAAMPAPSPPAALTASPAVASAASNPGPVASSAPVAAPALPASAAHASGPKGKGAKTKAPAGAGQHGKSGTVRPAPRSKPGAT
jgi:eukaryotic-like serine/threonine-protein kinase